MALYVQSDELKSIATRLKNKFPHNLNGANLERIVFLMELESPAKTKLATTKRIDAVFKVTYSQHDYILVVFKKRWENLNEAQRHILIFRQLLHCEFDGEKLVKPDVQDFFVICAKWGVNWMDQADIQDPLADDFNDVLKEKPVLVPDKYTKIMEEDWDVESNVSSQY